MTSPERRTIWRCHELLNAGEGPRGRIVKVRSRLACDAGEAAERAAEALADADEAIAVDNTERYIEVEGGGRFVVNSDAATVVKYRSAPP